MSKPNVYFTDKPIALDFQQGHAVVASRYCGDVLISFHDSGEKSMQATRRVIDLDPLRTAPAEVCYANNGNVRVWRLNTPIT